MKNATKGFLLIAVISLVSLSWRYREPLKFLVTEFLPDAIRSDPVERVEEMEVEAPLFV